jgi:hypothetical protein
MQALQSSPSLGALPSPPSAVTGSFHSYGNSNTAAGTAASLSSLHPFAGSSLYYGAASATSAPPPSSSSSAGAMTSSSSVSRDVKPSSSLLFADDVYSTVAGSGSGSSPYVLHPAQHPLGPPPSHPNGSSAAGVASHYPSAFSANVGSSGGNGGGVSNGDPFWPGFASPSMTAGSGGSSTYGSGAGGSYPTWPKTEPRPLIPPGGMGAGSTSSFGNPLQLGAASDWTTVYSHQMPQAFQWPIRSATGAHVINN